MVQLGERCAAMGVLAAVALLMFAYKTGKEKGMSDSLNFLCGDGHRCAGTQRRRFKLLVILGDSNLFFEEGAAETITERQRDTLAGMLAERATQAQWSSIYVPVYSMADAVHRDSIKWTLMSWLGWLQRKVDAQVVFVLALGQNDCLSLSNFAPVDPLGQHDVKWQNAEQKRLWNLAMEFGQMFDADDGILAYRLKFFDNPMLRAPENYGHAQACVEEELRKHAIQELDMPKLDLNDFADRHHLNQAARRKVARHVWEQLDRLLQLEEQDRYRLWQ